MEGPKDKRYKGSNRRAESRVIEESYSSVEFTVTDLPYNYQFKIWETSPSGMSILIRGDSDILGHIKAGDVLDMKYYPSDLKKAPESYKTEIKHITKDEQSRFRGHFLVGLAVLEKLA